MEILKSNDYTLFRFNKDRTRPYYEPLVLKLMESISKNDQSQHRPILVDKTMQVVDGNHRLEAWNRLGLPVYYRIINQQLVDIPCKHPDCEAVPWEMIDYLKFLKTISEDIENPLESLKGIGCLLSYLIKREEGGLVEEELD